MGKGQPRYVSYMLRLWKATDQDKAVWRASLEDPRTGEQHGFADLDALCAFLREQIGISESMGQEGFMAETHKNC